MDSKPPKKILIVVESLAVNDSSGAKANMALIKNLHKAGFRLQVYHYTRKNIQIKDIPCYAIKENRHSGLFFLSRAERYLRYLFKLQLNKPLEKLFGFSFTLFNDRNSIAAALKKNKAFEPDLVLTLSQGGSFRPHHALLKIPEWHHKWMAYIHDPYPMSQFPKPYTWMEPGNNHRVAFMDAVSKKAKYSAFPGELLMEWMGGFHPDFLKTGVVIPHQIHPDEPQEEAFPEYFDPEKFNLLHAGYLFGARNPKHLIAGYLRFLEKYPGAKTTSKLLFLGGNNKDITGMAQGSKNIYIGTKKEPFKKVYHMQQFAAINIILEAKAKISPFLPGKFPHCIAANKPVLLLGPKKSECRRLLGEEYKYWSEIDDEEGITKLIQDLYLRWKESPAALKLNRPDLKDYCSEKHLEQVIEEMTT